MKSKTVLHRSSELLSYFNQNGVVCFTHKQAEKVLKLTKKGTVLQLLSDMTQRGLLLRIKKGVYYIIPYEQDPETFMPDWHLLAQYIVCRAQYYIGYYSAMHIHSLATQPGLREQIVVNKQIKPGTILIKNIPFQFIYHNEKHFFGGKETWIDNFNRVQCSDLEKTFIDALFKPDYSGGISEIAKALHKSKNKIDFKKLIKYAVQFNSIAVCKRLGYLLELLDLKKDGLEPLKRIKAKSNYLLDPAQPRTGKLIRQWNLRENIDSQSILSPIFS